MGWAWIIYLQQPDGPNELCVCVCVCARICGCFHTHLFVHACVCTPITAYVMPNIPWMVTQRNCEVKQKSYLLQSVSVHSRAC